MLPEGDVMTTNPTKVVKAGVKKPPAAGKGRAKGSLNKSTAQLKEMILEALDKAGGVEYLMNCALNEKSQGAFLSLIGKVLPMTIAGDDKNPLHAIVRIERVIVDPKK